VTLDQDGETRRARGVVASILGWSAATTVRMAKRYGHIGQIAQRQAVELLDGKKKRDRKKASPQVSQQEKAPQRDAERWPQ